MFCVDRVRSVLGRRSGAPIAAVAVVLWGAGAQAAITINGPTNHVASVNVTGFTAPWTGTVTLAPDPIVQLGPPAAGSTFRNTFVADVGQYPGWTCVTGAGLGGTVQIDRYEARNLGGREGGAAMVATYTPAQGENVANIRWAQMFTSSISGTHLDPFPRNYNYPLYYTEAEHATHGMQFRDFPSLGPVADMTPLNYSVRFEVYLTTVNFNTKVVTVHDGWRWGYNFVVVPAPGVMGLALAGGLVAVRRRR